MVRKLWVSLLITIDLLPSIDMAFVKWGMEGLSKSYHEASILLCLSLLAWPNTVLQHPWTCKKCCGCDEGLYFGEKKFYHVYCFLKDMWLVSGWDLGNLSSYSWITADLETWQVSVIKTDQGNNPSPSMSQYEKRADTNKGRHNAQIHTYHSFHPQGLSGLGVIDVLCW